MSDYQRRHRKISLIIVALLAAPFVHSDETSGCLLTNGCAVLNHHAAYWETKIRPEGSLFSVTLINDIYFDPTTRRMTVYSQSQAFGRAVAPAQVPQGQCIFYENDEYCSHPSAVYLNGSGKELTDADGSGSWWLRQSWVLGGEGFYSSEMRPAKRYSSTYMTGELLEDGLTIKVGNPEQGFSLRRPIYSGKRVAYEVSAYIASLQSAGQVAYEEAFRLEWQCKTETSPLTGIKRSCPSRN